MTRHQQRLRQRYERAKAAHDISPTPATEAAMIAARDALLGDAIYRRNQARITPQARLIRQVGMYQAAVTARGLGISLLDFYIAAFGRMPRDAWKPLP